MPDFWCSGYHTALSGRVSRTGESKQARSTFDAYRHYVHTCQLWSNHAAHVQNPAVWMLALSGRFRILLARSQCRDELKEFSVIIEIGVYTART